MNMKPMAKKIMKQMSSPDDVSNHPANAMFEAVLGPPLKISGKTLDASVFNFFYKAFGVPPSDQTLANLPVDSACGRDCKAAIDSALAFLQHVKATSGAYPPACKAVIDACDRVCQVYWHG